MSWVRPCWLLQSEACWTCQLISPEDWIIWEWCPKRCLPATPACLACDDNTNTTNANTITTTTTNSNSNSNTNSNSSNCLPPTPPPIAHSKSLAHCLERGEYVGDVKRQALSHFWGQRRLDRLLEPGRGQHRQVRCNPSNCCALHKDYVLHKDFLQKDCSFKFC